MNKPTKDILISKRIYSSHGSSSADVCISIITTEDQLDFTPIQNSRIKSKKFPILNGEKIEEVSGDDLFCVIYLEGEKTFYYKALHSRNPVAEYQNTPEYMELVQSYMDKGYSTKERSISSQTAYWDRERERNQQRKKNLGVVLWMDYDEYKGKPEMYKGGFSDEIITTPGMYNYLLSGGVFGWIGNSSVRTAEHDKQIEAGLRLRGLSAAQMCNWLSSTSGRHFADSLEGESPEEQAARIDDALDGMFNKCLIFGCPSHKGTLDHSNRIENLLEEMGILLPTDKDFVYNSTDHTSKLIVVKTKLSHKEDKTPEEEYIYELVDEIIANKIANL